MRPRLSRGSIDVEKREWVSKVNRLGPLFLIALIGLMPATWFKDGLIISFFDLDMPLPPFYNFESYYFAWYRQSAPGVYLVRALTQLPFMGYFVILGKAGLSLSVLQAVYLVFWTLMAGFSMYHLFLTLYDGPGRRAGASVAAMLYMNNPVLYHVIWMYMAVVMYPAYAAIPLLLLLYGKGLRSRNMLGYAAVTAALTVPTIGLLGIAYSTYIVVIFITYVAFYVATAPLGRQALGLTVRFGAITGLLALLLHSWWLWPNILSLTTVFQSQADFRPAIGRTNLETMLEVSTTSSLLNLFHMQGHLASYTKDVGNLPWQSYSSTYREPLFIALGFVTPLLAVAGVLGKSAGRWRVYFGGLLILTLFLMKGAHAPLGEVYLWWFENFSFAAVYRAFYNKFGLLLPFCYSALAGLGLTVILRYLLDLLERGRKQISRTLVIVLVMLPLVIMISVWGYPYWTGEIIPLPNPIRAGAWIRVPDYYPMADAWLKEQGHDFRVMILPLPRLYAAAYDWDNGFWGVDPSVWLFSAPTIGRITTLRSYALPVRIAEMINSGQPTNIACLLGLLNVRYVLLHGDTSWGYVGHFDSWWVTRPHGISESWLRRSLDIQQGLRFASRIGRLYFYENLKLLPHTYVAHRLVYLDGGLDTMVSQYTTCNANSPPAIFLSELQPGLATQARKIEQTTINVNELPAITPRRLDPTRYIVSVKNARAPFILVFGESYDPGWIAEISGRAAGPHFLVNGYANAWYVEQTGSYDIFIHFKPQEIVEVGFKLSGLGVLLTIIVFVIGYIHMHAVNSKRREHTFGTG